MLKGDRYREWHGLLPRRMPESPGRITCGSEGRVPGGGGFSGVRGLGPSRRRQACWQARPQPQSRREPCSSSRPNPCGQDPCCCWNSSPVCEVHDPTGEPGAGNRHAGFGERGTGNVAKGAGLRPVAKAPELPPDPTAGAPAPDSTAVDRHDITRRIWRCGAGLQTNRITRV